MLSTAIPVIAVVVGIIASFLLASGFDFSNVGMGLYGIGIAAGGMPVSYTHLDVYKRQARLSAKVSLPDIARTLIADWYV